MSMPPIGLEWGGGQWPRAPKRRLRPLVSTGIALAADALDEFGVEAYEPKIATVWCVGRQDADAGQANNSREFDLHVPFQFIKHPRRLHGFEIPMSLVAIHELTHCVREEKFSGVDLMERAATEGLSMWAERFLAEEALTVEEAGNFSAHFTPNLTVARERRALELFMADVIDELAVDPDLVGNAESDALHSLWFENTYGKALPLGCQLGAAAVGRLIESGATLGQVMQLPPEDIIRFEI